MKTREYYEIRGAEIKIMQKQKLVMLTRGSYVAKGLDAYSRYRHVAWLRDGKDIMPIIVIAFAVKTAVIRAFAYNNYSASYKVKGK